LSPPTKRLWQPSGFHGGQRFDGIRLIYAALKKTGGKTEGDALVEAMKGMKWKARAADLDRSETRDIVQNSIYARSKRSTGELYNVEFETFEPSRTPARRKK